MSTAQLLCGGPASPRVEPVLNKHPTVGPELTPLGVTVVLVSRRALWDVCVYDTQIRLSR